MTEISTSSSQLAPAVEHKKVIPLLPPPLLTENPEIVKKLEDNFGFQFEKPSDLPLPTDLDPSLLGNEPDSSIFCLQQISRYPRLGYLYYPGEKEIADDPVEMERQERDEWEKLEKRVAQFQEDLSPPDQKLYQVIKENRFRGSVFTALYGYTQMLRESLPLGLKNLVDQERLEELKKEYQDRYRTYTLDQRKEFGQRTAEFTVQTLQNFSPTSTPTSGVY
jgi:hypothetical protein